ncbi:ATP-binding protein [Desulfogranum marinum]|uniref:ATP-binding protein n=1 Tax=Desulfogranum marinum TaxID=453220 RepID=UPI0029C7430A|nr:ATP-binding protein [Desulfogranum marinum]
MSELEKLKSRMAELENERERLVQENRYLRELYDRSPLGYQSLDENGCLIETNQAWLDILGYSREEVIGKNFGEFLAPDWQEHFTKNFPKLKAIGEILGFEFEMVKKDGSLLFVNLDGRVGTTAHGQFQQTYCIIKDITAQKEADQQQRKLEAQLLHTQKMDAIGQLAGGMAHDFNNILQTITGYTSLLQLQIPQSSDLNRYLETILRGCKRAAELVQQILDFSRRGQDAYPMNPSPSVQEALKLLRSTVPTTIEIRQKIDPDCGIILASPIGIHQILVNLCTNALHAMEAEKGILTVKLQEITLKPSDLVDKPNITEGPHVELVVTDTGCGIKESQLKSIFEPYFTTKEFGKGSGMGLAIVHGIVKSFGGHIHVKSEQGKGSEFYIYFPVVSKSPVPFDSEAKKTILTGSETILVVDDEKNIVVMYKEILEELGYTVVSTTSSKAGLDAFRASPEKYDVIITDQTMPHLTGEELAIEMLKIRPEIPIILCTGYSSILSEKKAQEIGIKKFMMKPVTRKKIAIAVREVLDQ